MFNIFRVRTRDTFIPLFMLSRAIYLLIVTFCLCNSAVYAQDESLKRRQQYLKESLLINESRDHIHGISRRLTLQDSTWKDWQKRTGELPPDFAQMPSSIFLPEPLVQTNGQPITTRDQWEEKRKWIKEQFQHWIAGHVPPAPDNLQATVLSSTIEENGARVELIELSFGPGQKGKMTFELMIPEGNGPFPVYMTQWTHRHWGQLAVRRGYIACIYAGADSKDDTQAYQALYPEYDFTALMRRAWGASRVVDYLQTRKEVNAKQIAITGHSRNGKQSLWAGAFDDRISAVISSSCGTGGVTPYRFTDPQYYTQTLDNIAANAAHWFQPRLRFFFGREDKLPIDQNLLLSLIAPRHLLLHSSIIEQQLSPWATEQTYQSVKKVYNFLDASSNVGVFPRYGEHAVTTRDLEKCIDFLDQKFGRSKEVWQNELYYEFDWNTWSEAQQSQLSNLNKLPKVSLTNSNADTTHRFKQHVRQNIEQLLGKAPSKITTNDVAPTDASRMDWITSTTGRPVVKNAKVTYYGPYTGIGDHLSANLYTPTSSENLLKDKSGKIPVIIYLHEYTYAHGYAFGYSYGSGRGNSALFQHFIDKGYAVLAIDMLGFGTRIEEGKHFYKRFPQWSKLGKMVEDVRDCVDALHTIEHIDQNRIFVLGNTIGGQVGLLASSLDTRIAGVATVAAFTPWRTSNDSKETIRSIAKEHHFLPQLGWYMQRKSEIPVDFPEIVASIAPRPVYLVAPTLDKYTDHKALTKSMEDVQKTFSLYQKEYNLHYYTPTEINRISPDMVTKIGLFFDQLAKTN